MEFVTHLEAIKEPYTNAVVTVGNFDGVHIGHQALFHSVVEHAHHINGTAVAMTFDPHPMKVLSSEGQPPKITLAEQKVELIEKTGIDVLVCIPFTKTFAAITAQSFIEDLMIKKLGMRAIVVGKDYSFGRNREGDLDMLQRMGADLGFEVMVIDWIHGANGKARRISSTQIRQSVMAGDMEEAKRMLGRYYQIRGIVAGGRNRGGRLLGFPTANINLQDELCPKTGIYAVTVEHDGVSYPGVANIGYSPTFDDHLFTIEVHLIDFDKDIYSDRIRVNFIRRLRDEIKFESIDALSAQIKKDVDHARAILSELF